MVSPSEPQTPDIDSDSLSLSLSTAKRLLYVCLVSGLLKEADLAFGNKNEKIFQQLMLKSYEEYVILHEFLIVCCRL